MYFPSFTFWRTAQVLLATPVVFKNITTKGDLYILNGETSYTNLQNHKKITRSAILGGLTPQDPGTFPGPIINGWKGDTFEINVHNNLTNRDMLRELTVHWHGINHIKGTGWADGVAFVTQCPIIPGDFFPYKFPVPDQAGTFWYHSHYSTQYCDGLRGALIIRDRQDPYLGEYDVDDDTTVLMLSDWNSQLATHGRSLWDVTLINQEVQPTFNVVKGKKYRFRLINSSCHAPYVFSIDGHNLTVIEVEGVNTVKYNVTSIPILAAQRYSFILDTTQRDDTENYWIRADMPDGFKGSPIGRAILHYSNAPTDAEPTTKSLSPQIMLNETFIEPLDHLPAPGGHSPNDPDVHKVDIRLDNTEEGFQVNGARFRPPPTDVLLQILSGTVDPRKILPSNSVISLPRNKTVQLTFKNADATVDGPHPIHLHGHTFSVVRSIGATNYSWDHPPRRDVVATSLFGLPEDADVDEVTIRFITDNPGPWILHCHIDWHLEEGLAIVLAEDVEGTSDWEKNIAPEWHKLCPKYWDWMSGPASWK